jgi:hypothetical protein
MKGKFSMDIGQNQIDLNIYFDENRLAQLKESVCKNAESKANSLSLKPPRKKAKKCKKHSNEIILSTKNESFF